LRNEGPRLTFAPLCLGCAQGGAETGVKFREVSAPNSKKPHCYVLYNNAPIAANRPYRPFSSIIELIIQTNAAQVSTPTRPSACRTP